MPKSILITGGATGFGRGTAFGLAQAGHTVIAGAQIWPQVWEMRNTAAAGAIELTVIKLDLLDATDRNHALTFDIDILVNNAGIMESGPMAEIPIDRMRSIFETNVFAHLELTQGFVRKMIRQGHGKVVWVSSIAGLMPIPWLGAYAASKHAIEAIAGAMREELKPYGIKVATINPGSYRTGFNDTGYETMYQWYDPKRNLMNMPEQFQSTLEHQSDPKEMIDAMVAIIAADSHPYRTVKPSKIEDLIRQAETAEWQVKV